MQAVQLDLSTISALLYNIMHMLNAAVEPSANWILNLQDTQEELATRVKDSVPDVLAFTEKVFCV